VWCEVYFSILNRLGVIHECNGRTDIRTDSITVAKTTLRGQKLQQKETDDQQKPEKEIATYRIREIRQMGGEVVVASCLIR